MAEGKTADIISAASAFVAILVFGFGVYEYYSSERWKRAEFVSAQIKDFQSDKINQAVLRMMDYDQATVELYPEKGETNDKAYVDVPYAALIKSINEDEGFSDSEFRIKQYFEHFLTSLARFNYFVEAGAITPEELCADFGYPVALMAGDPEVRDMKHKYSGIDITPFAKAVSSYLERWKYTEVKEFMQTIGKTCN
jgi:hypothetical protein